VTARSKEWVCGCLLSGFAASNPAEVMDICILCCRVEVLPSGWSLVQRSPTQYGVCECEREFSIMRTPCPTSGCCSMGWEWGIEINSFHSVLSVGQRSATEHARGNDVSFILYFSLARNLWFDARYILQDFQGYFLSRMICFCIAVERSLCSGIYFTSTPIPPTLHYR